MNNLACQIVLFAAIISNPAIAEPAYPKDLDEDGINDEVEEMLIERHKPWLYYDSYNSFWPSTLEWFTQRSNLIFCGQQLVLFSREELAADPLLALRGSVSQFQAFTAGCPLTPGVSLVRSNSQLSPGNPQFGLDLLNEARPGMGPLPVGMYGHVVPVVGPIDRSCGNVLAAGHRGILVQYWQFFPMNESTLCSDHEGDWLRLDLYLDNVEPYTLRVIVYDPHGSSVADRCLSGTTLPTDGIPRCYLENDSHEMWPSSSSSPLEECESHDGDGVHIRADNILNIGERWAPMSSWDESPGVERSLALFYNGEWGQEGDNPGGPASQSAIRMPGPSTFRVRYVDSATQHPAELEDLVGFESPEFALGSRYFPAKRLSTILDKTKPCVVESGGVIMISPGNYPQSILIDRPVELRAPAGPVVLGQ